MLVLVLTSRRRGLALAVVGWGEVGWGEVGSLPLSLSLWGEVGWGIA